MKIQLTGFLSIFCVVCSSAEIAFSDQSKGKTDQDYKSVNRDLFVVPEGLEVTIWAQSPSVFNPTNMDIDKDGRIWVAEGVRYRRHFDREPKGDRIVVLEDTRMAMARPIRATPLSRNRS